MRVFPPVPTSLLRTVPKGGDTINGHFVPEGGLDARKASQPFSLGPRGCIGRNLSYIEQRLMMGRLLWNFDVYPADAAAEWSQEGEMRHMRAFLTWEKPDLNVRLVPVARQKSIKLV
ncbi:Isotrichodermin C-15 hydroxylase-like protein [Hapsidospora chrysogenum ATCC 11550]|uniref:Isotrichodermin C-15 hydroxylase-like protein n=1 Tax=Hapsidospora chrysogenum (strain ATCC 11550 / CBS 779.69 / DSM 880 / IAM 14645 / JCM 23072 / IMI 49137) TaxID=857340 RepID=A0A086TBS4_HAPC1|nr:Isotrichodermin C-15 hydroxylase-like protein [Hapsidospora chrysogenum ATCC 11550]